MKQVLFLVVAILLNVVLSSRTCVSKCVIDNKCSSRGVTGAPSCLRSCVKSCSQNTLGVSKDCSECRRVCNSVPYLVNKCSTLCRSKCSSPSQVSTLTFETPFDKKPDCFSTCTKYKNCQKNGEQCELDCKQFCNKIKAAPFVKQEFKQRNSVLNVGKPVVNQGKPHVVNFGKPVEVRPTFPLNKCVECLRVNNCLSLDNFKKDKCRSLCSSVCPTRRPNVITPPQGDSHTVLGLPTVKPECLECLRKNECFKVGKFGTSNCKVTCRDACLPATTQPATTRPPVTRPAISVCVECLRENKCLGIQFGSERCNLLCPTCPTRAPVSRGEGSAERVLSVRIETCKTCLRENQCYAPGKIGTQECQTKCQEQCGFQKPVPPRPLPEKKVFPVTAKPTTVKPTTVKPTEQTTPNVPSQEKLKCFTCVKECLKTGNFLGCKESCKPQCTYLNK